MNRERLLERRAQLPGDGDRGLGVHHLRQEDAELVAAQPGDRVALTEALLEPETDLLQQLVAARMAERVIDLLEAVEVHDHHGRGHVVAAGRGERVTDAVVEERAVGQVRERVVERLVLVHLGLVPKRLRRPGDDPEENAVEHCEREEDEERVVLRPVADAGLDSRIGDRDLHGARRPAERLEPERDVDGQVAAGTVSDDPPAQREPDVVRERHPAVDLAPPRRVDDLQGAVPDGDPLDVLLVLGPVERLVDREHLRLREPVLQVVLGEETLDFRARDRERLLRRVVDRALRDPALKVVL